MHTRTLHRRGGAAAVGMIALTLTACGTGAARPAATTPAATAPGSHQHHPAAAPPTRRVAPAATTGVVIGTRATGSGLVLVTATGRTLYTFAGDRPGHSACTGACATAWPPLIIPAGDHPAGRGRLPGRLGVIVRGDGRDQAGYDARPLYTFAGDHGPGQTHGQGIKGVWFVALVDGRQPAPVPAPPATRVPVTLPSPTPPARPPAPPTMRPAPANPIPQGGGGDGDADNSGGPNDGDGNR